MLKKYLFSSCVIFVGIAPLQQIIAQQYNNLTVDYNITTNSGRIKAGTFLEATTNVTAGGFITAGGYIQASGQIRTTSSNIQSALGFTTTGYINAGSGTISSLNIPGSLTVGSLNVNSFGDLIYSGVLRSQNSQAFGQNSAALGVGATAPAYSTVAIGRNNLTTAADGTALSSQSTWQWIDKDPLFLVGNGSGTVGDSNRYRNAFAIYKDGTIIMSKTQGDILAGQFGVTPTP